MIGARPALGLVVALGSVALLWLVFVPRPAPAERAPFTSSQQCLGCHAEVGAEWSASWHARAWTDPDVRALSNDFANTDCIDCHAPRPVFETGVDQRVLPRAARRQEGVDCISCHALAGADEGRMAGTLERDDVACRPKRVAELSGHQFCATCHNQHQTVTEWLVSRYAAQGIGCIDCHMPFRGGDPARGRDHTMHGGHSLELVQSAVALRARRGGAGVVVELENVGAGHCFPTDERSRAADLFWRPLAPAGEAALPWRHLYRFRSPYRDETALESTLLPPGANKRLEIDVPEDAGAVEVALFYKLTPYWKDPARPDPEGEARLVHRVTVEPLR